MDVMKKIVFISAIIVLATACKKDYTCTCITTENTGVVAPVTEIININAKKSNAEDTCNSKSKTDANFTTVCNLN